MSLFTRRLVGGLLILLLAAALGFVGLAWQIVSYGNASVDSHADAALVLGAAAWGNKPSPVYRERINEAIALYKAGRVRYLVFTGGTPEPGYPAEGEVGRKFAIEHGVPAALVLFETSSRTTWQNLVNARELLVASRNSDGASGQRSTAYASGDGNGITPRFGCGAGTYILKSLSIAC